MNKTYIYIGIGIVIIAVIYFVMAAKTKAAQQQAMLQQQQYTTAAPAPTSSWSSILTSLATGVTSAILAPKPAAAPLPVNSMTQA